LCETEDGPLGDSIIRVNAVNLRLYLGEIDDECIEVEITEEQWRKLRSEKRATVDDGGIRFAELILVYEDE
jgi:hypothetical protein